MEIFQAVCEKNDILYRPDDCFAYLHEFPEKYQQMNLFDCGLCQKKPAV